MVASLIETYKLIGVEPHGYLPTGSPGSRLDELPPSVYPAASALKDMARKRHLRFIDRGPSL